MEVETRDRIGAVMFCAGVESRKGTQNPLKRCSFHKQTTVDDGRRGGTGAVNAVTSRGIVRLRCYGRWASVKT